MVLKRLGIVALLLALGYYVFMQYNTKSDKIIVQEEEIYGEKMKNQDELISREVLFGNPDKIAVRISNNGEYLSFIAPHIEVLNIWIAPIDNISQAKPITNENSRGIRNYFWAKDNLHVIYLQDKKGDEDWNLYSVNIETGEQKNLTPYEGSRASILKVSEKHPHHILALINDRVPEYFDIYKIDVNTGDRELIYQNSDNYSGFLADDDFRIRVGYKMLPDGTGEIYLFKEGDISKPELLQTVLVEDMTNTDMLNISADGTKLFMTDSKNRNTSAMVEIDLISGDRKILYESDKADIDDYLADTKTKMIQAIAINYLRKVWTVLDSSISKDMEILSELEDGDFEIVSRTYEDTKWVIAFLQTDRPIKYYLYDRLSKTAKFLFFSNSKQEKFKFAKMHPLVIKSRDGLDLISYLTVPRWLDDGQGIPPTAIPLVLYVHGGPNARDEWRFDPTIQWLANRGYAVLNVNYRGSIGFGKEFTNAGDGQWSGKMQRDLEDGVQWCIDNKIADKDKIVIMGGSYGGYATLVGMTMTPEIYVAGIDIVGPSNLETLVKSIPAYWKPNIGHLKKMLGYTPDTDEGSAKLKEMSPLTYAENIKRPLLIVQGANDPRVKQAESDQIVAAMKAKSIPVVYLLYPDEGHGLVRPENRLSMFAHAEIFLANFAGGRFIEHDNNFPSSSIEVREGKDISWTKIKE